MDPAQLKQNFTEQIEKTEVQIRELEENLAKAKEYKLKLTGGLETLGLLEEKTSRRYSSSHSRRSKSTSRIVLKSLLLNSMKGFFSI